MAVAHDQPIVRFSAPPVVEVVAGLVLRESDPTWGPVLAGFWRSELREEFPTLEYQPPYTAPPAIPRAEPGPSFQLEFSPVGQFPRMWAGTPDRAEVVQLQPSYFACNWRKVGSNSEYDSWAKRRTRLSTLYSSLLGYSERNDISAPLITECEVTYVNHIRASTSWSAHSDWRKIFNVDFGSHLARPALQVSSETHFAVASDGQRIGTLVSKIAPAFAADGLPIYVFELTGRAVPLGDGLDGALRSMDVCRQAIDESFVALTTEAMQEEWGRDGSVVAGA